MKKELKNQIYRQLVINKLSNKVANNKSKTAQSQHKKLYLLL